MSTAIELKAVTKNFGNTAITMMKNTMLPMIGPKKKPAPPMNVASSTPPERTAPTFSAVTIS